MTPDELCDRAAQLRVEGQTDEAFQLYLRALTVDPDHLVTMANLRDLLTGRRQYATALGLARRLVEAAPLDGVQWDRLASVYMSLDRFDEAAGAVEKALELAPDNPVHWHQGALLAHRLGNSAESLAMIQRAFELNPYGIDLKLDYAHFLLSAGEDLATALEAYEVRWEKLLHLPPWDLHLPEWKGEPLVGKRVLFHSEQGLGDAIMMARFARDLAAAGASLVGLALPFPLTRLFQAQRWPGVRVVDIDVLDRDDWDLHTPMFSAFRHLKLTRRDIGPSPYLTAPKIVVPPLPAGLRVGICWASGRWNIDTGLRRLAPLGLLVEELGSLPGVRLVSLQQGGDERDIAVLGAEALIANPMPACDDFAATAAVIAQLDAVVTVDTAVLHLAAAMGRPTFMLCQFTRCWRWWNMSTGSGLPWYETISAAKQTIPNDWRGPVAASRSWLKDRCP